MIAGWITAVRGVTATRISVSTVQERDKEEMNKVSGHSLRGVLSAIGAGIGVLILIVVGMLFIWRMRLGGAVNHQLRVLQTAGFPTSGSELNAWYASVPDDLNAALVLTQAFALLRVYPDRRSNDVARFKSPPRGQALTSEQRELLAGHVELNAEALAKGREALVRPKSRYPVDFSPGFDADLSHLGKLRSLAQAAHYDAMLAIDSGNIHAAAISITDMLGLARTLEDEPALISQLVRLAIIRMAVATVERALAIGEFSDADLSRLRGAFAALQQGDLIARALVGERAMTIPRFRMSRAEMNRLAKPTDEEPEGSNGAPVPGPAQVFFRATGFFERDLSFYLRSMETNITLASLPPPRRLAVTNLLAQQDREARRRYYIFSGLFLPPCDRAIVREIESFARARVAETALAVERFRRESGRLPQQLIELVPRFLTAVPADPFDGASLRYHPLSKGYVVYSIGPDGRDDGGKGGPEKRSGTERLPEDIALTVER
jgi:hypothetical protein